jgi:hypothetical protein
MNFILNKDAFKIDYIHLLEPKHNIIMNGNFTKIFYSTPFFILNNIFIDFEIVPTEIHQINSYYTDTNDSKGKYIMYFDVNSHNTKIINKITEIEKKILEYYLKYRNICKICECTLRNQIMNKNLKFYKNAANSYENSGKYYLKISGIWENHTHIGITYKVVEYFDYTDQKDF